MYYTYGHIRPDTGVLFYVGKGCKRRAYSLENRNNRWHNIVNKNDGNFTVVIFNWFSDEADAYYSERWQIAQLKHSGHLVNQTPGGEGGVTFSKDDESYEIFCNAVKEGHAKRTKESWGASVKKRYETLSKKDEAELIQSEERRRLAISEGYSNQTEEKKALSSLCRSFAAKKAHANKSPEEKAIHGELIRAGRLAKKADPNYVRPLRMGRINLSWWNTNVRYQNYWGA